ncbi:MAG: hypothetical protein GY847_19770 [Proteobacteria bacterium]|nr:hypothetical protein [Pseudomonadota bacterium]
MKAYKLWFIYVAVLEMGSALTGCGVFKDDPCDSPTKLNRTSVERCFGSAKWRQGGAHDDGGKIYSLMWKDHDHRDYGTSLFDWTADYYWDREVVILEHTSGDPGQLGQEDPIVYYVKLSCAENDRLFESTEVHTGVARREGYAPLSETPLTCESWPDAMESVKNIEQPGECYSARFCQLGSLCVSAQLDFDCPPVGSICVEPERADEYNEVNADGLWITEDESHRVTYNIATGDCEVDYFRNNLLANPGASDGINDWIVVSGYLESLSPFECKGVNPYTGGRYFTAGGLCSSAEYGEAYQRVDVSNFAEEIDTGEMTVYFGGAMRNFEGEDKPEIELMFLGAGKELLGRSDPLTNTSTTWRFAEAIIFIPAGTRSIDFVMIGTRNHGRDNDCYFDDLTLEIIRQDPDTGLDAGVDAGLDAGPDAGSG